MNKKNKSKNNKYRQNTNHYNNQSILFIMQILKSKFVTIKRKSLIQLAITIILIKIQITKINHL